MKALVIISALVCFCFASGGDTIRYTADVKNLKDGDNFYSDIHYHPMKDSIAKIVNGKLGNINIAADAEIDLSKLDTAGSMKFNTLTTDKHTSDTVIADTAKVTGLNATRATIDSSTGLFKIGDSLYIGRPNATSGTTKKSLTFQPGGFSNPGAYLVGSNGDKIVLYSSASSTYDGRIGIGSSGNLWFKSASPGGTGSIEFYVDSACTTPMLRITRSGIQLNGGDLLSVYDTGSFSGTLTGVTSGSTVGTFRYTQIGKVVTVVLDTVSGAGTGSTMGLTGWPTAIATTAKKAIPITLHNNGTDVESGYIVIDGTTVTFSTNSAAGYVFSGTGNRGIGTDAFPVRTCITYIID